MVSINTHKSISITEVRLHLTKYVNNRREGQRERGGDGVRESECERERRRGREGKRETECQRVCERE